MAGREIEIGPVGRRVGQAVQMTRRNARMTLVELSGKLDQLGRPIAPNSLARLERGERRVDVDDLVALATALGVLSTHLLEGRVDAVVRPVTAEASVGVTSHAVGVTGGGDVEVEAAPPAASDSITIAKADLVQALVDAAVEIDRMWRITPRHGQAAPHQGREKRCGGEQ